ncbi:uncharacterized protein LOC134194824 isoform X2 [Corticium candelabrum]|uniref:uncharacterized protein LOC134194824 isoform X2 n=1 Tax=Corticium candelabrum TaxID=121492 RepID=UPI002E25DB38|nr:uncharacterized protein LOC134194824 isoform X2 [Corticium candelabrum]
MHVAENSVSAIRENVIGGVRPKISEDRSCPSGLVQLIRVCWMSGQTSCPLRTNLLKSYVPLSLTPPPVQLQMTVELYLAIHLRWGQSTK